MLDYYISRELSGDGDRLSSEFKHMVKPITGCCFVFHKWIIYLISCQMCIESDSSACGLDALYYYMYTDDCSWFLHICQSIDKVFLLWAVLVHSLLMSDLIRLYKVACERKLNNIICSYVWKHNNNLYNIHLKGWH